MCYSIRQNLKFPARQHELWVDFTICFLVPKSVYDKLQRWRPCSAQFRVLISLVSHGNFLTCLPHKSLHIKLSGIMNLQYSHFDKVAILQSGKVLLIKMESLWIKVGHCLRYQVENQQLVFPAKFVLTLVSVWGMLAKPKTELCTQEGTSTSLKAGFLPGPGRTETTGATGLWSVCIAAECRWTLSPVTTVPTEVFTCKCLSQWRINRFWWR